MIHCEPIFVSKPETWHLTDPVGVPISLTPMASSEHRQVRTYATFSGCEIYLAVPLHWQADRVQATVAKFRQAFSKGR